MVGRSPTNQPAPGDRGLWSRARSSSVVLRWHPQTLRLDSPQVADWLGSGRELDDQVTHNDVVRHIATPLVSLGRFRLSPADFDRTRTSPVGAFAETAVLAPCPPRARPSSSGSTLRRLLPRARWTERVSETPGRVLQHLDRPVELSTASCRRGKVH